MSLGDLETIRSIGGQRITDTDETRQVLSETPKMDLENRWVAIPRGFESLALRSCDVAGHRSQIPRHRTRSGPRSVVLGRVQDEASEQFAGVAVDDPEVEVTGEELGAGPGAAKTDVVQSAVVAQGDRVRVRLP